MLALMFSSASMMYGKVHSIGKKTFLNNFNIRTIASFLYIKV
jgi:hypothetical protein